MPKNDFWDDEPDEEQSTGPSTWKIWSIVSEEGTHCEGVTMAQADEEWKRQHKRGNTSARYVRAAR